MMRSNQLSRRRWRTLVARVIPRLGGERGQSLIELALIMPVFATILIGSAELARLAYASIEVTNAARAGVQYGAQSNMTGVDLTGMENVAKAAGPNVSSMNATASLSCVCSDGTSITCSNTTACTARIQEYVQVNTSATMDPMFHLPGLPKTYTLTGAAVQRVEQ